MYIALGMRKSQGYNYARIFGQNTEPVDYYATVWCENMADCSAIDPLHETN